MHPIHVGNAPCSWGDLELAGLEGGGVHYVQMLDELVETGYDGTELGARGFLPTHPTALRAELETREVTMLGAFVSVSLSKAGGVESKLDRILETCQHGENRG